LLVDWKYNLLTDILALHVVRNKRSPPVKNTGDHWLLYIGQEKNRKNSRTATRLFLFSVSLRDLASRVKEKRRKRKERRKKKKKQQLFLSGDHSRRPYNLGSAFDFLNPCR
jgi:intergrase/recombinase